MLMLQPLERIKATLLLLPPQHLMLCAQLSRRSRAVADNLMTALYKKRALDEAQSISQSISSDNDLPTKPTFTAGERIMFIPPEGIVNDQLTYPPQLPRVTNGEYLNFADVAAAKAASTPYCKLMVNDYWRLLSRDCRHNMGDASILYDRSLYAEKDADVVVHRLHAAAARTGGILWLAKKSAFIADEDEKKWKMIAEGISGVLGDQSTGI